MKIIDSHHHIWRRADLPWLLGPTQPRIFGPYDGIKRDYPIAEFLDDIAGTGVEKSVYVQANWDSAQAEQEVAWVQSVADADTIRVVESLNAAGPEAASISLINSGPK